MKLPAHDVDRLFGSSLPVCKWCPAPARFRFYGDTGRSTGCLLDFMIHRSPGDNYSQLILTPGENQQEIEAMLESVEVQARATDVDVFLYELEAGLFDEDLDQLAENVRARIELRGRALATTLRNGDRVKIVGDIRPTFLQNAIGVIKSRKGDKFSVSMETAPGRVFQISVTFLRPQPKVEAAA